MRTLKFYLSKIIAPIRYNGHVSLLLMLILLAGSIPFTTCDNPFLKERKSEQLPNQPPETYLFLFFDSDTLTVQDTTYQNGEPVIVQDTVITTLDTTASRQELHWWGEDSDGEVVGYWYQWNYMDEPVFTSAEAGTFYVPIRQQYDIFDFQVQAVDNDSLIDPVPAKLSFPVFNSFPHINFRNKSNPPAPAGNPDVTNYTFPTRTFVWDAVDPDGNETITEILWTLDDTTEWNVIQRDQFGNLPDHLTLTEIPVGYHTFYLKARDIASAESNLIMFPDTSDDNVPNHWYVKPAVGSVLLVNDFSWDQNDYTVQTFYTDILEEIIAPPDTYSVWEIGSTFGDAAVNQQNALPYSSTDIEAYLNYFEKVIWFCHLGKPHITESGLSMTRYIKNGGHLFITNGNEQAPDTTWLFTSIDSTFRLNPGGRLLPDIYVNANFGIPEVDDQLNLRIEQLIGNRVSALIPKGISGTHSVYKMQHPDSTSIAVPYQGTPVVALHFEPDYIAGESIYLSLPLHYCNGDQNVKALLDYIINDEFED